MFERLAHSLVTRIILFGALLTGVGVVIRLFVVVPALYEDMNDLVASQQLAIATYVAHDVDRKLNERRDLLARIAEALPPALLTRPDDLARWLAEHQRMHPLFSRGLMLVPTSGRGVLAETTPVAGRQQLDFADSDWFRQALAGQPVIGRPLRGRANGVPVIILAAPVRDAGGAVAAVLAGVEWLDAPGFLKPLREAPPLGGFLLISPQDRLFVTASDPSLVLTPTPPPGVNLLHDRAMAGFRGTGITINAKGIEELSAIVSVPATGWFVVSRVPTEDAFRPVHRLHDRILRNSLIVTSIVLILLLWGLPRLLRPLTQAARQLRAMADGKEALHPLPVRGKSEIDEVAAGFNYLLDKLRDNEKRMAHLAHHDPLTGLPNRLLLEDRLHQALARAERAESAIALLFLDLDGFKPINDAYGHEIGDAVLRQVAERLLVSRRRTDTVARLGGDEFIILLTDAEGANLRQLAQSVAEACIAALASPFFAGGHTLQLGVSIGIALHIPGDDDADHLLNRADMAMYAAKQAGRGRYEFFNPTLSTP